MLPAHLAVLVTGALEHPVTLAILRLNGARRAGTVSIAGVDYFLILPLASNCLR